ncbi:CHAT domain-containing protein [Streptomyces globisporus]|uniref:CHAT domain-containing protein n=1 Tax=Streptomyces globisporus TaxID=1908 RepID=UPI0037990CBC
MDKSVSLRVVAAPRAAEFDVILAADDGPGATASLGPLPDRDALRSVFDRNADEADRRAAGDSLHRALFREGVAEGWNALRQHATPDDPMRAVLTIEPPELRSLPWELLWHQGTWLWRDSAVLLRRGLVGEARKVDPEFGPRRVLVIVATPADDEQLLAEQELAVLSGLLEELPGRAHVEVLDCPQSLIELCEAIEELKPHVLHFIGHGMPRPGDGGAELAFSSPGGHEWRLTADEVPHLSEWRPGLVVLNACRTAAADPADWVGGIAHAFLDAGTRAVVSMQADIESPVAVVFAESFYTFLIDGHPVDRCVNATRQALGRLPEKTGAWALPVLLTRSEPDAVLPRILSNPEGAGADAMLRHKQYVDLRRFVGRVEERRKAWWALDDPRDPDVTTRKPVLVISGQSQSEQEKTGKTWLANWCLGTWFLRGHHVISVDLAEKLVVPGHGSRPSPRNKDWLAVLRMIRQEATSAERLCSLPKDAFGDFNSELNRLAAGGPGVVEGVPHAEEDEWLSFNDDVGHADERKSAIMDAFVQTLRRAAGGRPLVLALDHADTVMGESLSRELYEGLIRPIAYGRAEPLRLVIVAPDKTVRLIIPDRDSHMIGRVQVGDFKQSQLMRLARIYSHRLGCKPDAMTMRILDGISKQPAEHFDVNFFQVMTPYVTQWKDAAKAQEFG